MAFVAIAVNIDSMIAPTKIQITPNKRPREDFGILSPYLLDKSVYDFFWVLILDIRWDNSNPINFNAETFSSKIVIRNKRDNTSRSEKINYPTVVSETTAHQNPSGEPAVNEGENCLLFVLCSCVKKQHKHVTLSLNSNSNIPYWPQLIAIRNCKITEMLLAVRCVLMRVCRHGCDV